MVPRKNYALLIYLVILLFSHSVKGESEEKLETKIKKIFSKTDCGSKNETLIKDIARHVFIHQDDYSEDDIKLMGFIAGSCLPIVVVPGLYGTKLQMQIDNCEEFKKHHPEIYKVCNFENNCKDGFDKIFWLSEDFQNSKDSVCTGKLLQIGYKIINKNVEELSHRGFKITFFGNTQKSKEKSECGFGATSDLFDKFSYFFAETPKGFKDFKNYFKKLGYEPGVNLFAAPIDWRRRANDPYNVELVKETVDFAYNLTHKPVILIGHSFGGMISISYLHSITKEEKKKKVARWIPIVSPLLGASKVIKFFILGSDEFNNHIDIMGIDVLDLFLSMENQKIIASANSAGVNLFPTDFFKNFQKQRWFQAVIKRGDVEDKITTCIDNIFNTLDKSMKEEYFEGLVVKDCINPLKDFYKAELEEFKTVFPFFPDLEPGCGIAELNSATCQKKICKSSWDTYCRLNIKNPFTTNLLEILEGEKLYSYKPTDSKGFLELVFKYGLGKPDEKFITIQKTLSNRDLEKLTHPDVPISLIYMNNIKTEVSYKVPENPKKFTDNNKFVISNYNHDIRSYGGGDGTVNAISLLVPGFKWANDFNTGATDYPIQMVSYCNNKDYINKNSQNSSNQYISLKCRCKKNGEEGCIHATVIGDSNMFDFVKTHAMNDKNVIQDPTEMQNAFNLKDREMNFSQNLKCKNLENFANREDNL